MTKRRRRANYVSTLVYVDEPQLILFDVGKSKAVAVAVAMDDNDYEYPFLATVVNSDDWKKYYRGTTDLRYLFLYAKFRKLYLFDLMDLDDNSVMLDPIEYDSVPKDFFPSPGFFSRDHTADLEVEEGAAAKQSFLVDGEWELPDFAHFYGRLSDLYAFIVSLAKFKSKDTSFKIKNKIKNAFLEYPWRGGSSYVHFYRDLAATQTWGERLSVDSIQYASPGHVDVTGRTDAFSEISATLNIFEKNRVEASEKYNHLHSYLSKGKWLRSSVKDFDNSSPSAGYILKESRELAELLNIGDFDLLYELSDKNALATAKVVLAHYRRLDQSFMFFAEGRVQFAPD